MIIVTFLLKIEFLICHICSHTQGDTAQKAAAHDKSMMKDFELFMQVDWTIIDRAGERNEATNLWRHHFMVSCIL